MNEDTIARVRANPKFQELVRSRSRLAWRLAAVMLVVYFGFILILAFDKSILAARIGAGIVTWGMPIGLGVIIVAFVLTGIYVGRANNRFDRLNRELIEETK
jgi:uncharacterized membrane protein (DUF485 family)